MHADVRPLPKPAGNRSFGAILLLSLLLHGGVCLWVLERRLAVPPPLPPIVATLRLVAAAQEHEPAASGALVRREVRQQAARSESHPAPRAMPAAGPTRRPAAAVSEATAAPVAANAAPSNISRGAASDANPTAERAVAREAAPAGAAESAPASQPAAAAVAESARADALAGYRRQLAELFARHHEYPRVAAMRGWEGEVRVRLRVARKGSLLGVALDRSSGFEVLDRHALTMIEDLASLPALPEALDAGEIQVVVPINYKLRKTT